jgi:EAL domain-containing protein (putative c-di-GMP-specific phosphodiesterase class I)
MKPCRQHKGRDTLNDKAVEMLAMETGLRRAIAAQEFMLHYQPIIDVSTRKIIGTEALVRWKTTEGNLVMPAKFIPVAEATGLIVPIGKMVVQMACRQNKIWHQDHGQKIRVSINVSGLQFGQKTFVQDVLNILHNTDLDPRYVELEITETTIMADPQKAVRDLQKLKKAGITIALDDFGTGYSSFGYLQRLPLDVVKIDMSFITNVVTDMNDAVIVKSIIAAKSHII